jgi:hypothetical protein
MPGLDPGIHRNKAAGESPPFLYAHLAQAHPTANLGAWLRLAT